MNDPLRDPRFPSRPQSPDFWRLSESVLYLDGQTREGGLDLPAVLSPLIDPGAASYMAINKAEQIMAEYTSSRSPALVAMMSAMFLNGLAAGIVFERRGGHRD